MHEPSSGPDSTMQNVSRYTALLNEIILQTGSRVKVFEDTAAPQNNALQWIAYDDRAALTPKSANLIQRYSLMCLFFGLGGASTRLQWDEDETKDECNWFGVTCRAGVTVNDDTPKGNELTTFGSAAGIVSALDLPRMRLSGSLVSEIGLLHQLESLDLGENYLYGGIPESLFTLAEMRSLILEKNSFGPHLAEDVSNLVQLETLSLNNNRFEGELPTTIARLQKLKKLYLFSNDFSGRIMEILQQIPALEVIDVYDNIFTGTIIPSLRSFSELREFAVIQAFPLCIRPFIALLFFRCSKQNIRDYIGILLIGRNLITGTIPTEIGELPSLEFLSLDSNALKGSIPTEIGQLRLLQRLDLSQNGLSSSLPHELGNLNNLELLAISGQSLTGVIPSTFGNFKFLLLLDLSGNYLKGVVPPELGKCKSLLAISLQSNDFSGTMSGEICKLRQLPYFLDELLVDCVSEVSCDSSCCTGCT